MITWNGVLQIFFLLFTLLILVKPLGLFIAKIYQQKQIYFVEKIIYRLCGISYQTQMNWKDYLSALLIFNFLGLLVTYLLQRIQFYLPLNPEHFSGISPYLAFNSAVSFVTNTDWQAYHSETSMSYLTRMLAFTTQNFCSAATSMAVLIALIRGLTNSENSNLGNFWVDVVRSILYIFLPLSCLLAILLIPQGVIQNYKPYQTVELIQPVAYEQHKIITQTLPMGPAASQIAIKQLGTNGGGFFNANAAHPFENPTPLTNFLEMLAILLIPAALCFTFGVLIKDKRQGWAILTTMLAIFIPLTFFTVIVEQQGNPILSKLGINPIPQSNWYTGGNMEGKETRFGIVNSALWSVAATATANGGLNSLLDSYLPLAGMVPLWMIHLQEVVFGGVGSGLYSMLLVIIMTVFVSGLMVGRTPEYLGKKIETFEMKMVSTAIVIIPINVLVSTAYAVITKLGTQAVLNSGPHGLTEILYAFASEGVNNGSAFSGLKANTTFYHILGGLIMLTSRYWIIIAVMAMAGSLAMKKKIPISSGTLETHTPFFILLVISMIFILAGLSFYPVLALGPITEHLMLWRQYGN